MSERLHEPPASDTATPGPDHVGAPAGAAPAARLLALQRTAGNRATAAFGRRVLRRLADATAAPPASAAEQWVEAPEGLRTGPPPPGVPAWEAEGTVGSDPDLAADVQAGTRDPTADVYRRPRRAARAFLDRHSDRSVTTNREAMGFVVRAGKRFTHTAAIWGGLAYRTRNPNFGVDPHVKEWIPRKSLPVVSTPASAVATVHTHGARAEGTAEGFSPYDFRVFEQLLRTHPAITAHYLGTPSGFMRELRPGRPRQNPFFMWTYHRPGSIHIGEDGWTNAHAWAERDVWMVRLG